MKKITLFKNLLIASCFIVGHSSAQSVSFTNASGSPVSCSSNPRGIVSADFNGDGKIDYAVGTATSNQVYIYLGQGNGTFVNAPGSPMTVGNGPIHISVADLNGDSKPDLIIPFYSDGTVGVYLGTGNGSFTMSGTALPAGNNPYFSAIADFNNDGKLDFAEVNQGTADVYVYLGNGSGSFTVTPSSPITVGSSPYCVVSTDFNGDGKADLAVVDAGTNAVEILLGNGNGTFTAATGSPIHVGPTPRLACISDFNGDGKKDLAVTNFGSSNLTILLGNGNGTFNSSSTPTGNAPYEVVPADINFDGKMDVMVSNALDNTVSVLFGDGAGGFTQATGSPVSTSPGTDPQSMCLAAFTGSHEIDIAVANYATSNVSILVEGTPFGIQESTITHSISLFPNPSNGTFTLQVSQLGVSLKLKICSALGKELKSVNITTLLTDISLNEVSAGVYFYKLMDGNQSVGSSKLVIEK